MAVRIALFGQPRVVSADGKREFPLPRKTLNVLAYLILKSKRVPTRDSVAFALFPDEDEEKARASLRRNLSYLLSSLPAPEAGAEPFVMSDAERIGWNFAAPAQVDVLAFEHAIAEGRDDDALREYTGALLPTLYDEWTTADRERLRDAAHDALTRTIGRDRSLRRFDAATAAARRLLEDDPWREDIVRELIAIRYEAGDRAGALAIFSTFAARLRDELGAEPMDETTALREAILRGARLATSEPQTEQRAPVAAALPFVGRDEALRRAIERWHTSADGRAGALFLAGEAGIGKSRLAAELTRAIEREGGMTIIGETAAGGERRPYEAVIEALRYATPPRSGAADRGDAWAASIEQLLDVHAQATLSDDRSARMRLFDAIRAAMLKLARSRPLAIVLEDLHWAGAATIDLVAYLIDRLASAPVLIIGTYRDDELTPAHPLRICIREAERAGRAMRIALNRLAPDEAVRAATEAAPPSVTAAALEAAAAWSEGVPLLLSEAVRDLAAGREFNPGAFLGIIGDRVASLPSHAETALTFAAVLGARFELDTLAAASGWRDDELVDALAPAVALGLIRAGGRSHGLTFAFAHHLVHAAILERIGADDRTRVHGLAARALDARFAGGDRALEIAQHYAAAGATRRAAEHYAAGARYALDLFANIDARDAATAGLTLIGDASADRALRYDLIATRERALARVGGIAERAADATLLCTLADGDDARLCAALERLIEALRTDKPAQQDAFARLEALAARSERAAAVFARSVATEAGLTGDFIVAADSALRAAQQFDAAGDPAAALRAQIVRLNSLTFLGRHAEAWESIVELRPAIEASADAVLQMEFSYSASAAGIDGRRDVALRDAERSLELALMIGDRWGEAQARHNVAWAASNVGEGTRAIQEYDRAIAAYEAAGNPSGATNSLFNLAAVRGWNGDYETAFALLDRIDALELDQPWMAMQSLAHRGSLWLRAGDLAAAESYLTQALDVSQRLGNRYYVARIGICNGEIAARRGNFGAAVRELLAAASELEALGFPLSAAEAHALIARVHAEASDAAAAAAATAATLAQCAAVPEPALPPKSWWDLTAANALAGDETAARGFAERAARTFCDEALDLPPDLAEAFGRLPWHVATFAFLAGRDVSFSIID